MAKKSKHLDFDINLIPFIDLLSSCICFLLLTAVWIQVGSVNVKQSVGAESADNQAKKPTVWVKMAPTGDLSFDVHDANVSSKYAKFRIPGVQGKPDLARLSQATLKLKAMEPRLATALIMPQANSVYEDMINVMDQFKKSGVVNLGVSPL